MSESSSGSPLPPIRRARDYHLYTEDGRRLLDLYLDDGAALFGHRPDLLGRELKSVLGRGLLGNLPSSYAARLRRALRRALPGHTWFGLAATVGDALELLRRQLAIEALTPREVQDPVLDQAWLGAQVAWWRPLCDEQPPGGAWLEIGPAALVHRLPFAVGAGPVTVSTRRPGPAPAAGVAGAAAAISPVLLAGATFALQRLERTSGVRVAAAGGWPPLGHGWRRSGIYVVADFPRHRYGAVWAAFLAAGVLLNPRYPGPSILPGTASAGELALLRGLFHTCPGA